MHCRAAQRTEKQSNALLLHAHRRSTPIIPYARAKRIRYKRVTTSVDLVRIGVEDVLAYFRAARYPRDVALQVTEEVADELHRGYDENEKYR